MPCSDETSVTEIYGLLMRKTDEEKYDGLFFVKPKYKQKPVWWGDSIISHPSSSDRLA